MNAQAPIVRPVAPATAKTWRPNAKQVIANKLLSGPAMNVLLRGGSRSGKTFIIVRRIIIRALRAPGSRHCVWRFHYNHAKQSIGLDTFPKVLKLCFPELVGKVSFSHEGIAIFPNGSEFWLGGLDDQERVEKILGLEFATNYFNEGSQIPFHAVEIAQSRLAQLVNVTLDAKFKRMPESHHYPLPLKNFYDMNPPGKRHWSHDIWIKGIKPGTREPIEDRADYVEMRINPDDNRENLPPKYFNVLDGLSATKRKRFKEGEWASDAEGQLWTDDMLDAARVGAIDEDFLVRVVIGVDPSGSKGDKFADVQKSNDIGIVVAGLGKDGRGYVLEDGTVNLPPGQWAAVVAQLYDKWKADLIVAELNYGGAMVESTIKTARATLPVKMVTSSRGKALRAEPISALYEGNQRKVSHVGYFGELEDQMAAMMPQPIGYTAGGSPDRLDALVFALTELMLNEGYHLGNLD